MFLFQAGSSALPPILSYCFPLHFCDISKRTMLESKWSTDGHWESENNCSLTTRKVISQCRSRVTQQQ